MDINKLIDDSNQAWLGSYNFGRTRIVDRQGAKILYQVSCDALLSGSIKKELNKLSENDKQRCIDVAKILGFDL